MTTAPATRRTAPVDVWWTPWPGIGPGTSLLGTIQGRHIIELGCGNGDNAAALASAGAHVVGVDKSATAIRHARARWHHQPRLRFVHDDAATYLAASSGRDVEIVCSVFGALTFMPADETPRRGHRNTTTYMGSCPQQPRPPSAEWLQDDRFATCFACGGDGREGTMRTMQRTRRLRRPAVTPILASVLMLAVAACADESDSGVGSAGLTADANAGLTSDGIDLAGDLAATAPHYRLAATIDPVTGQVEGELQAELPTGSEDTANLRYFPALVDPEARISDVTVEGSPAEFDLDMSLLTVELDGTGGDPVRLGASFSYEIPETPSAGAFGTLDSMLGEDGLQPADIGLLGRSEQVVTLGHWYPVWIPEGLRAEPAADGFGDISNFPAATVEAEVTEPEGWTLVTGGVRADQDGERVLEAGYGLRDLAMTLLADPATREATVGDVAVRVFAAEDTGTLPEVADETVASLEVLAGAFGAYPWVELDVVATPLGSGVGGMEFPGMIWIEEGIFAGGLPGMGGFDLGDLGDLGLGDLDDATLDDVFGDLGDLGLGDLDLGPIEDLLEDLLAGPDGSTGDGEDHQAGDPDDRGGTGTGPEAPGPGPFGDLFGEGFGDLLDTLLAILLGEGTGLDSTLGETDGDALEGLGLGGLDLDALLDPDVLGSTRAWVVAHEVAHQWWHAIVGNDSISAPIVDEPLAQYSSCLVFQEAWPDISEKVCEAQTAGTYRQMRMMGVEDAPADQPTDAFDSSLQYGGVVYGKAPVLYPELAGEVGEDALLGALADVVSEHAFGQISSDDLRAALGKSLDDAATVDALWARWIEGTYGDEDLLS